MGAIRSEIVNSRDGNASKRLIKTHGALSRDTVYNRHALFITAVETASERFTEYTGADPGEGVIIYKRHASRAIRATHFRSVSTGSRDKGDIALETMNADQCERKRCTRRAHARVHRSG